MTRWWNTCSICGKGFSSVDPSATVCPDVKRHAEIGTERRTRKDDKKDGGKK